MAASDRPDSVKVIVPVTYRREWHDGFGARGWKLDVGIGDEYVVASTAYCGENIPTSVLIHDIVDHHLCGLRLSGHRDEAMALVQLQIRTGADITPDYAQMVDEDILQGQINGEALDTFLPEDLLARLPEEGSPASRMGALIEHSGKAQLRRRLIDHFFALGEAGRPMAEAAWRATGLDYGRRADLALALQGLLAQADERMRRNDVGAAHGRFVITDARCRLAVKGLPPWQGRY